jgi:flagellar biosynthesis anti-sigma factor FlgM
MVKNTDKNKINNIPTNLLKSLALEPSKQMESLKELIFNSPDTRHAKIDFIKNEIDTGRYQIEPENIATKIMEEHIVLEDESELA